MASRNPAPTSPASPSFRPPFRRASKSYGRLATSRPPPIRLPGAATSVRSLITFFNTRSASSTSTRRNELTVRIPKNHVRTRVMSFSQMDALSIPGTIASSRSSEHIPAKTRSKSYPNVEAGRVFGIEEVMDSRRQSEVKVRGRGRVGSIEVEEITVSGGDRREVAYNKMKSPFNSVRVWNGEREEGRSMRRTESVARPGILRGRSRKESTGLGITTEKRGRSASHDSVMQIAAGLEQLERKAKGQYDTARTRKTRRHESVAFARESTQRDNSRDTIRRPYRSMSNAHVFNGIRSTTEDFLKAGAMEDMLSPIDGHTNGQAPDWSIKGQFMSLFRRPSSSADMPPSLLKLPVDSTVEESGKKPSATEKMHVPEIRVTTPPLRMPGSMIDEYPPETMFPKILLRKTGELTSPVRHETDTAHGAHLSTSPEPHHSERSSHWSKSTFWRELEAADAAHSRIPVPERSHQTWHHHPEHEAADPTHFIKPVYNKTAPRDSRDHGEGHDYFSYRPAHRHDHSPDRHPHHPESGPHTSRNPPVRKLSPSRRAPSPLAIPTNGRRRSISPTPDTPYSDHHLHPACSSAPKHSDSSWQTHSSSAFAGPSRSQTIHTPPQRTPHTFKDCAQTRRRERMRSLRAVSTSDEHLKVQPLRIRKAVDSPLSPKLQQVNVGDTSRDACHHRHSLGHSPCHYPALGGPYGMVSTDTLTSFEEPHIARHGSSGGVTPPEEEQRRGRSRSPVALRKPAPATASLSPGNLSSTPPIRSPSLMREIAPPKLTLRTQSTSRPRPSFTRRSTARSPKSRTPRTSTRNHSTPRMKLRNDGDWRQRKSLYDGGKDSLSSPVTPVSPTNPGVFTPSVHTTHSHDVYHQTLALHQSQTHLKQGASLEIDSSDVPEPETPWGVESPLDGRQLTSISRMGYHTRPHVEEARVVRSLRDKGVGRLITPEEEKWRRTLGKLPLAQRSWRERDVGGAGEESDADGEKTGVEELRVPPVSLVTPLSPISPVSPVSPRTRGVKFTETVESEDEEPRGRQTVRRRRLSGFEGERWRGNRGRVRMERRKSGVGECEIA